MTQLSPPELTRNEDALYLDGVKLELTKQSAQPIYSVRLITTYELPFITVYYQAGRFSQPVEVAHIYMQPEQGHDANFLMRAWMNDFTNAYMASVAYTLHGGLANSEDGVTFQIGDPSELEGATPLDTSKPSVITYMLAVPPAEDNDPSEEPTIFALAQVFESARDSAANSIPELNGYNTVYLQGCLSAITDIQDTRNKPAYVPKAQSLKALLAEAERGLYFSSMNEVQYFNPPHTMALGLW